MFDFQHNVKQRSNDFKSSLRDCFRQNILADELLVDFRTPKWNLSKWTHLELSSGRILRYQGKKIQELIFIEKKFKRSFISIFSWLSMQMSEVNHSNADRFFYFEADNNKHYYNNNTKKRKEEPQS